MEPRDESPASALWAALRAPVPRGYRGWLAFGWTLLILFGVQVATGMLLSLYYQPEPDAAGRSMQVLMRDVPSGWLVRGVHAWSSRLMVALAVLQLARAVWMRAWRGARAASWTLGLALFLLLLALAFSGALLPWDAEAYGALHRALALVESTPLVGPTTASLVRGGDAIGATTLSRVHTAHSLLLPWLVFLLATANVWLLVRRARSNRGAAP